MWTTKRLSQGRGASQFVECDGGSLCVDYKEAVRVSKGGVAKLCLYIIETMCHFASDHCRRRKDLNTKGADITFKSNLKSKTKQKNTKKIPHQTIPPPAATKCRHKPVVAAKIKLLGS